MRRLATLLLVMSMGFAGCLADLPTDDGLDAATTPDHLFPDDIAWDTSGPFSKPLELGDLDVLPVEVLDIESHDGTIIKSAVWRPDTDAPVPVILEIGPYWGDRIDTISEGGYEDEMFLKSIVPHGFAYARVAVRGTSASGGCMEFFSVNEQKDMDEVVTYFGTRDWSNGNVGLWGGSYDGTTQWMAAMFGNPHLKTIVPISGLTSIWEHAFPNGTAWAAGPVFHGIYWMDGWTTTSRGPMDKVENTACPESWRGVGIGPYTTLTGEKSGTPVTGDYWEVRDFRDRILENYEGSVFLIHGLQDWRVPPHMAFPFVNELEANGNDVKMLLGQWWHDLPDRASRGEHVRWDHAEILLRWYTKYLYEDPTVDTGPAVDVEDNRAHWRTEATWPPQDAAWTTLHLGDDILSWEATGAGAQTLVGPANAQQLADDGTLVGFYEGGPAGVYYASLGVLHHELRFAGAPKLHVTVTPTSPEGGRLYAELVDVTGYPYNEEEVVAHAVMDLRYYEGGSERQDITPGEPVVARMQFFPADVVIPAGHELALKLVNGNGYAGVRHHYAFLDNFVEHPTPTPVQLHWGDGASVLELPVIERDVGDGTYPGQPT